MKFKTGDLFMNILKLKINYIKINFSNIYRMGLKIWIKMIKKKYLKLCIC